MERFLVSAATGAMRSLLGKLGTMMGDEYKLLKDVRGNIEFLRDELEAMHAFLLMMADVEEPDPQAKLRSNAVRELSYEIEDKVDKFMLLVNHEPSSKTDGFMEFFDNTMKKITNIKTRHKIAKDVKDIRSQVTKVSERYVRYNIDKTSRHRNKKVDPRLCAVYKDASQLVGIKGPRNKLVKLLSYEESEFANEPKVISIVGSGGLGKTTLARQVYDKIGADFECRAFVSISRSPDVAKILSSILSQLHNREYALAGGGDPPLIIDEIRDFLANKRYFIIVDDIWDIPTWQTLDCALLKNSSGSVIMTTTRIHDVAQSCCSSHGNGIYNIQPLSDASSRKLFFKRIFGREKKCPASLREVSEDILKKCGGLPLAINAISSLLATGRTKEEWDRVRHSICFAQGKNSDIDAMAYILSLSYFDLPLHLRSCLLYLTMFPEDCRVKRVRLVHLWISEGFIHGEDGENLVELGETYFHELVNRSLIQPVDIKFGKALYCQVHDTVLDFLIYMSSEENFSTLLSNKAKLDCISTVRRVSLMGNEDPGIIEKLDFSHVRSLITFEPTQQLPSLVKSNALRVLDLEYCSQFGNHHVKDIGRLLQLRYLNIEGTSITELPKQVGNFKFLETLITPRYELFVVPESITRLKRLARLSVSEKTIFPDGIGNMKNLQMLRDINPFMQSLNFVEGLGNLINLRKLGIYWDTRDSDIRSSMKEKLAVSLCKLDDCKLCNLCITFCLGEEDGFIRDLCFRSLNSVRKIYLAHGEIRWITRWLISLPNLEKLCINSGDIEQRDVEMLASISTLVKFDLNADWEAPIIITGGFEQLQKFYVGVFNGLMFEEGTMPNLKELTLVVNLFWFKSSGSGFDFGIQHLSSLASLRVTMFFSKVSYEYVDAAEDAFNVMAKTHPNRPTLEISIYEE
ncbi:disease resistance protein RGA5-like [Triticum dicoccoides]|uniref:disease resistance protein RGA5-like n=1 Tax=Triticum dicoccoides TaxID=85692 RepID=UPI00188F88ED|nr:disease resistance protein RGA5-like [Triticum dicoccoides]